MVRTLRLLLVAAAAALVLTGTAGAKTYYGKVAPGFTIALANGSGAKVSRLPVGKHTIRVRDRSAHHNFHLLGLNVNRKTTLAFVGLRVWTVRFYKATYVYRCDPHRSTMRGSFKAV